MAKKILKRSLALGALMAFVITGSAMAATVSFSGKNVTIGDTTIGAEKQSINITSHDMIIGENDKALKISSASNEDRAVSDSVSSHKINLLGITIDLQGAQRAVSASASTLTIGNEQTDSIFLKQTQWEGETDENSIAVIGLAKSKISLNAKNITIVAEGYSAAHIMNSTEDGSLPENHSVMEINADVISVTNNREGGIGLSAHSHGEMIVNGDLNVNATNALDLRGNSKVRINEDGAHKTVLNGDIVFETNNQNDGNSNGSGKLINSDTLVVFNGKGSEFNGRSYITYQVKTNDVFSYVQYVKNQNDEYADHHGKVTGFAMKFSNGATWNITDSSFVNTVDFGAGSVLNIDDVTKYTEKYAINGNAGKKISIDGTAKLVVGGATEGNYKIVDATDAELNGAWAKENIVLDNALMTADWDSEAKDAQKLDLVISAKAADDLVNSGVATTSSASILSEIGQAIASGNVKSESKPAADFIQNLMSGQASGNTPQAAGTAINSALQIGEAGGNSGTALSVVNNVAGVTTQRLSFSQMNTAPQGGHGKVERKYKTGAGVWAQYMHGKDKVEDMPMDSLKSSYESQYNGAVIGYDFKEVGKTQTGIAFNYGEGDSHSTGGSIATRSDFDFWGIGLYHNIMNDDTNLILDVNYSKSDSDVTQINGGTTLTANPETTTLSAGVKFEKLIQNGPVQIVPYAGLRFMSVDTDDYAANIAGKKAFMYAPDRQNIWLIPVGVSLRQENTYENGWRVTPKADLSYIWAVGDTDSSMTVSIPGITNVANMNYTVMDNGSFLGTLGIEAEKGDWTYGLSYSYQKGEYQRSDKWFVDVRYSF